MSPEHTEARSHYAALLAHNYVWIAGGFESNIMGNTRFFTDHSIRPAGCGTAIDLGAGCGFQSIALACTGFDVVAVDFSQPMLDLLTQHAGALPVGTVCSDIILFESWTGRSPELIVCMGDTLTHLPDVPAVHNLIRQCAAELPPGGKFIVSFRDYSGDPEVTPVIIPVRRDPGRIFVCRLEYEKEIVRVTDILYTRESGKWIRVAGTYPKLRLAPERIAGIMTNEGFFITEMMAASSMTMIIAKKADHHG